MRGIGGPLLCIGDLLSDIGDPDVGDNHRNQPPRSPSSSEPSTPLDFHFQPSDLPALFQENYDRLNEALAGTDHSWTSLTLKLCTTLESAKKLIETTNSNVNAFAGKVEELERIVKKGDSAMAEVRSIHHSLNRRVVSSAVSQAPSD